MNFNVIIADDEYFIRQRLKKLIPWNELKLTLVGDCENGLQVIDLLAAQTVDLLILDIQMPKMTGIEVAEYIYSNALKTKIIILSGYNDFEYAQKTLRLGVIDYLLKPIDPSSLIETLSACIQKISTLHQESIYVEKYHHYEKQIYLNRFLLGNNALEDLYHCYPQIKSFPFCTFISFFINDCSSQIIDKIKNSLTKSDMVSECFKESESIYLFQVFFKHNLQYEQMLETLYSVITPFDTYIFGTIGDLFYIEDKWLPHYKKVLQALNIRYFHQNSCIKLLECINCIFEHHKSISKIRQRLTSLINQK